MANADRPNGFRPQGEILRVRPYKASGVIYPGDAVTQEAGGRVGAAAATNALIGVAATYASGADVEVLVYDHPDQLFVGQCDGADVDAQTDIGLNYSILATAGNSTYKLSRMEVDSSTQATTAALELKVLGIDRAIDNALGEFCKVVVKINNHQLSGGTGTLGV